MPSGGQTLPVDIARARIGKMGVTLVSMGRDPRSPVAPLLARIGPVQACFELASDQIKPPAAGLALGGPVQPVPRAFEMAGDADAATPLDAVVAQLQAATSTASSSIADRWRGVLFQVLHLMATRKGTAKPTSKQQNTVSILLLAFDAFQVLAVLTSPELGYTTDLFAWTNVLSLEQLFGFDTNGVIWFTTVWAIAVTILVLALVNAVFVATQVSQGSHTGSLWPLLTLRGVVAVILTGLYVPLVKMASQFLSCARLGSVTAGGASDVTIGCWDVTHIVLFTISVTVLACFVPFALVMRSVFFDAAPVGNNLVAKPLARTDMLDTLFRTAIVVLSQYLTDATRLNISVTILIMYSVR
jgi:hypothetical protein